MSERTERERVRPAWGERSAAPTVTRLVAGLLVGGGVFLGVSSNAWAQDRDEEIFGPPRGDDRTEAPSERERGGDEAPDGTGSRGPRGAEGSAGEDGRGSGASREGAPRDDAERARDEEIFGSSSEPEEAPGRELDGQTGDPAAEPPAAAAASRDDALLGRPDAPTHFSEDAPPEDPLAIGGLLYLRAQSFALEGQKLREFSFSVPSLLDVYLDVRPNERVRGFVLGRMIYDPTLPPAAAPGTVTTGPLAPGASTAGALTLSEVFRQRTREPQVLLDQFWLNFDVARTLFVTAGKQHVRWGTARFWMPTDFLHLRNRNPIDVFDARVGTNLLKVHLPIESLAWNFYGYVVAEDVEATQRLGRVAGALRGEFVVGTTEIGLGVFGRREESPRFAADISTGIGDFDFYGEVALRDAGEVDRVRFDPNAMAPAPAPLEPWEDPAAANLRQLQRTVSALYPTERLDGYRPQAVGGVTYTVKYNDQDTFTLGGEYFYNGLGYDSVTAYPGLFLPRLETLQQPASFFYLGKHYGALYASFPRPFSLETHTFTLSTLGNLSDQSFLSRLDYSYVLHTHLTFEAFVAIHYGRREGEFRFGVEDLTIGDLVLSQPPSLADFGVALRLRI